MPTTIAPRPAQLRPARARFTPRRFVCDFLGVPDAGDARPPRRLTLAVGVALAATSVLAACGAKQPAKRPVGFAAGSLRSETCATLTKQRASELADGRYLPGKLLVHRWPGAQTQPAGRPMAPAAVTEADFAAKLASGAARGTLILARGGSGKSKLAWSLEAQLCGQMPVVRVDLKWDVRVHASGGARGRRGPSPSSKPNNPVLQAVASALQLSTATPAASLERAIGDRPWLLLLDSLDEIPLDQRRPVVAAINQAMTRFPKLHTVVFTRPPVFHGSYGLAHVEGMAELPGLSCARTEQLQQLILRRPAERAAFAAFIHRYGLDRKVTTEAGRCTYPHLATYRDFFVVKRIAASQAPRSGSPQALPDLRASRAQVYAFYLTVLLIKDLQGVSLLPADGLLTVDRMVAGQAPRAGVRNLLFRLDDCMNALPAVDAKRRRVACERLLQSSLFSDAAEQTRFKLRNQSLADFFLARHMAQLIRKRGCGLITERAALFESNEVAGFLAGLPEGQRCLAQLTGQLCSSGGFAQHNFAQLDQGLPAGSARLALLRTVQESRPKRAQPNLCVTATLDRLRKVVTGQSTAAPSDTPAPEKPGK